MQTEIFTVRNVKCGGCAAAITKGLSELPGVSDVQVDIGARRVTVAGEAMVRAGLAATLATLGYPEDSSVEK